MFDHVQRVADNGPLDPDGKDVEAVHHTRT
jgi:hypothetical protein